MFLSDLTQEYLKSILEYNPKTGLFIWITSKYGVKFNSVTGSYSDGYLLIVIDGKNYRAHRLAWLYMTGEWPKDEIDHRNTIRDDNRWENLREATQTQNFGNMNAYLNNTSGYKGVYWDKHAKKWKAQIQFENKKINLGRFKNIEDAAFAYEEAAIKLFKEFARS